MSNARNLSKVEVDTNGDIEVGSLGNANDASALTTGTLGSARLPAGSVLQVVQDTFADTYSTSSTGGTPFRSVSITPSSASSKILVLASFMTRATGGGGNCYIRIQGFRNGSMFWNGYPVNGSQNSDHRGVAAINYLDSPNTTSAVTYSFNFDSTYASTVYINSSTSPSFITLMEIAG